MAVQVALSLIRQSVYTTQSPCERSQTTISLVRNDRHHMPGFVNNSRGIQKFFEDGCNF